MMLDRLKGRKIVVLFADAFGTHVGTGNAKIKGILTDFDNDFIVLDNSTLISRKFIIRIET